MKFTQYTDVHKFHDDAWPSLCQDEVANNLMLSILAVGAAGNESDGWRDASGWFMATVADDVDVHLVALMTPPRNLILCGTGRGDALPVLVDGLLDAEIPVPGVVAEAGLATSFAEAYTATAGRAPTVAMPQRIYELTSVNPDVPVVGTLRLAGEPDLAFLPFWMQGFAIDCGLDEFSQLSLDIDLYRRATLAGTLHVLEADGVPVAMAKEQATTSGVCRVSYVYTPPYLRNHGYASACVAALSQGLLDRDFTACVLYTDLANPVSNSIYQRIGYRPHCDSLEIRFDAT